MKKYIYLIISILLLPIVVNAETITYDVCVSGCEYTKLSDLRSAMINLSYLNGKDIVINIGSDLEDDMSCNLSFSDKVFRSLTINGNDNIINDFSVSTSANNVIIKNVKTTQNATLSSYNAKKLIIENSEIQTVSLLYFNLNTGQMNTQEVKLNQVLEMDEKSTSNLQILSFLGNAIIDNMNFSKCLLYITGGTCNIYNSKINKILSVPMMKNIEINIYNSEFNSLKFKKLTSLDEWDNERQKYYTSHDLSTLNYDIYSLNIEELGGQTKSITTVYFDKEAKLKPDDKLNLVNYLDYYTEDKEIEYTIEDESIAKIENKELIGLKEGSTNVTVTTDEGHVIYRINLVVEKKQSLKR